MDNIPMQIPEKTNYNFDTCPTFDCCAGIPRPHTSEPCPEQMIVLSIDLLIDSLDRKICAMSSR